MKFKVLSAAVAALLSPYTYAEIADIDLPAMVVSADFRPSTAQETPISLTTFDSELIESRGAQHIEDILNLAPNVNISSGASRGQFFQIRGMGARGQFYSPMNPSVGLLIDGIDFSRTGGGATLFDIEHVEILRGPQGTRYGTNALAGIINMQSTRPTEELDIHVETGIAEYNARHVGVAVGGPLIDDKLLGRASIHTYQSDGFTENKFLNRDNTSNRDETTARGHLTWLVDSDLTIDLNLLHLNIDNGYDTFSFDNSRTTFSDDPGKDTQHTNAFSIKTDWRANDAVQLQSEVTYAKSDTTYVYDADWGYDGQYFTDPLCPDLGPDFGPVPYTCPYIGSERFERKRESYSFELRALSNENGRVFNNTTDWAVGIYHIDKSEGLNYDGLFGIFGDDFIDSQYDTKNTAIFTQLDTHINDKLTFISGLRVERFSASYTSATVDESPSENLFGGKLGLNYQLNKDQLLFTSLSRGYKSGGVNSDSRIDPSLRSYETEYSWSLEAGVKSLWLEGDLSTNISVFYTLREDAQVKSSISNGVKFIDFQANAAKGKNIGVEADLDWLITSQWRVLAAVGLLSATFDEYNNPELAANGIQMSGRRQAHAPAYQFSLGGEFYFAQNWTFRANIEGKDEFYYSNSHNLKSSSYALINSSLDYRNGDWKVSLWGRNLFDKDYTTRGYLIENDPTTGYTGAKYTQKGDPRVVGVNVSWDY